MAAPRVGDEYGLRYLSAVLLTRPDGVPMSRNPFLLLAALIASVSLIAVGCSDDPEPVPTDGLANINVRLAQAPGAESQVLTALYAEAYSAAGAVVETEVAADADDALAAVRMGDADLVLDFGGRIFTEVLDQQVTPDALPARVEVAASVRDGLASQGISALNRASYNAVGRVVCTGEGLRRVDVSNLSDLAASTLAPRYVASADQSSEDGALTPLRDAYPGLFAEPADVPTGTQFAALRDGMGECALGPAGAPQIDRFGLIPLVDDRAATLPNQAVALANSEFVLAAPDDFAQITDRVTALLDDARVRELNAAVQLDDEEPADVAQRVLAAGG